jgi:hypothetical protein
MIADKCVAVRPASEDKGESGALWTRTFATAMDELCAKLVFNGAAASQLRIAATESVSLCERMKN